MTEGTQPENIKDVAPAIKEEIDARSDLDKATFEAPSKIDEGDIQSAENVQEQFTALVTAAADTSGADGRPETEDRKMEAADTAADGRPETEDQVEAANTAADGGPKTEDRVEVETDEKVMIDTVPLPKSLPLLRKQSARRPTAGRQLAPGPHRKIKKRSSIPTMGQAEKRSLTLMTGSAQRRSSTPTTVLRSLTPTTGPARSVRDRTWTVCRLSTLMTV